MRREVAKRLALLEAKARTRQSEGLDYSVLDLEELRELRAWTVACGSQDMIAWTRTLPEDERERFGAVFRKLVRGQRRAA